MAAGAAVALSGCRQAPPTNSTRASGQVDATAVHVAPEVGGRILEMPVNEGDRVKQGDLIARIDTRDADLALRRAHADRDQADAQLRLLLAGSRSEDIRQAKAQLDAAAGDVAAPPPTCDRPKPICSVSRGCWRAVPARRNSATMPRREGMWRASG